MGGALLMGGRTEEDTGPELAGNRLDCILGVVSFIVPVVDVDTSNRPRPLPSLSYRLATLGIGGSTGGAAVRGDALVKLNPLFLLFVVPSLVPGRLNCSPLTRYGACPGVGGRPKSKFICIGLTRGCAGDDAPLPSRSCRSPSTFANMLPDMKGWEAVSTVSADLQSGFGSQSGVVETLETPSPVFRLVISDPSRTISMLSVADVCAKQRTRFFFTPSSTSAHLNLNPCVIIHPLPC